MRYNLTCRNTKELGSGNKTMDLLNVIKEIKKYFKANELVCSHIYARFGDDSLLFFRDDYLETILFLRRHFGVKMYCNHNGMFQRGARCNMCEVVKSKNYAYLSPHVEFCGGDWTFDGYTAEQMRTEIKKIAHLLPHPIRLEKDVTWVHIDTLPYKMTGKVTEFTDG